MVKIKLIKMYNISLIIFKSVNIIKIDWWIDQGKISWKFSN